MKAPGFLSGGTDWKDQLESVAIGLLTLEVNTIKKCGMSAQKMPDVPIALHSIVDCYSDYLTKRHFPVEAEMLGWAKERLKVYPPKPPDEWFKKLLNWQPSGKGQIASVDLTNGAASFEALRWAAEAAIRKDNVAKIFPEEERAVIARIMANCRQLTSVVLDLERSYNADVQSGKNKPKSDEEGPRLLIGGTLEQTAHACFDGGQTLTVPMKVSVLLRKVWDIGTETVLAQTSVQVDGDVVTRVSPTMALENRDFLLGLHNDSTQIGLQQWKTLFDLVAQLIGSLAKQLFKA